MKPDPLDAETEAQATRTATSAIVAANVRAEAARRNLHSQDLALHLEIKPQQVLRKMRGEVLFTVDELGVLAEEVFGMADASELLRDNSKGTLRAIA